VNDGNYCTFCKSRNVNRRAAEEEQETESEDLAGRPLTGQQGSASGDDVADVSGGDCESVDARAADEERGSERDDSSTRPLIGQDR
jgi:hypothetical protein